MLVLIRHPIPTYGVCCIFLSTANFFKNTYFVYLIQIEFSKMPNFISRAILNAFAVLSLLAENILIFNETSYIFMHS